MVSFLSFYSTGIRDLCLRQYFMFYLEWWPPGSIEEDKQEMEAVLNNEFSSYRLPLNRPISRT